MPPTFILRPDLYKRTLATHAFIDTDAIPQTLSDAHFAVVGIMGEGFENPRLREVFVKLTTTLVDAYAVLEDAVRRYSQHFRGAQIPEIRERKGILSEKCPRKPSDRPRSQRVRNGPVDKFDDIPKTLRRSPLEESMASSEIRDAACSRPHETGQDLSQSCNPLMIPSESSANNTGPADNSNTSEMPSHTEAFLEMRSSLDPSTVALSVAVNSLTLGESDSVSPTMPKSTADDVSGGDSAHDPQGSQMLPCAMFPVSPPWVESAATHMPNSFTFHPGDGLACLSPVSKPASSNELGPANLFRSRIPRPKRRDVSPVSNPNPPKKLKLNDVNVRNPGNRIKRFNIPKVSLLGYM